MFIGWGSLTWTVSYSVDCPPSRLTQLPPELLLQVLSYLPLRSVLAVSLTCKAWRTLALDNGVWWRLWQEREGIPRLPSQVPCQNTNLGRRMRDSLGGFGRRYRGIKDEGVHGLSLSPPEHNDRWDAPSGWAVDFERANRLLERGSRPKRFLPERQSKMNEHSLEEDTGTPGSEPAWQRNPQLETAVISKQSPLLLDWRKLYHDRTILEQRWRDPEGEPHVLRIDGHSDRQVCSVTLKLVMNPIFSVYCLDFDSSRIITGSRDRTIKVWCIQTGALISTFVRHTGSVLCLKFERDWDIDNDGIAHGFMISGSSDCTVCVWNLISTPVDGERSGAPRSRANYSSATTRMSSLPRKVSAQLVRVLRGHSAGVVDLKMDDRWIVSWCVNFYIWCESDY